MRVAIFEVFTSFLIFPSIYNKTGVHHIPQDFLVETFGQAVSKNKHLATSLLTNRPLVSGKPLVLERLPLSHGGADRLEHGLHEVLPDRALSGFDLNRGGHTRLNFQILVGAAAESAAVSAHLCAVIGLFALAQVLREGVGTDVG